MTARPRVAVAGFQHESSSFSPFGATYEDFVAADGWPAMTFGETILELFPALNIPIGGFLAAGLFDPVPIVWANAEPCGPVSDDAFERIAGLICDGVAAAGPIDAVYLDLHGAMMTASHEDGEGVLLERLRARLGDDTPIVVSLDMHANITEATARLADAMTVYRTYPHVDMAETGRRAALLLQARLDGGPLARAFRKLPFLVPLSAQCTDGEPLRSIYEALPGREGRGVLSADIASGFPPADVWECGGAVLAYGRDQAETDRCADALLAELLDAEPRLETPVLTLDEAVARAIAVGRPGSPVVLADVQDNPGAGATSDTTAVIAELARAGAQSAAVAVLWDPQTASAAHAAGLGGEIEARIGDRFAEEGPGYGGRFRVEALSDGRIVGQGAILGGVPMALGPMAQLRLLGSNADVRVVVSSQRYQCLDRVLFRAVGIEPEDRAILVVKSTVHFRADFAPMAAEVLMFAGPGAHPCRLSADLYTRLRPGVRFV